MRSLSDLRGLDLADVELKEAVLAPRSHEVTKLGDLPEGGRFNFDLFVLDDLQNGERRRIGDGEGGMESKLL